MEGVFVLLFTLLVLYHTIVRRVNMYFLQGLLVGLATFAPVGMQNLFIINTALVQPVRRIILTLIILAFF